MAQFMRGSPILLGNNTVPGVQLPEEIKKLLPDIFQACRDFGLDFYPTIIQFLTYDEISEVAAYGGFPVRFPHWKWGMEYEELSVGFEHGLHRIYEMVLNTNPCYIYCLNSNTLVDNITVIAHATGHNDFFKNNIHFEPTSENMLNELANNGTRIRRYMARWGKEKVTEFIDYVLRLETLVDPAAAWKQRKVKQVQITDVREHRHPHRINVPDGHNYMESWINPKSWRDEENKKNKRKDAADELDLFKKPAKDVLGFLRDNAPLKPWQADIVAMLHEEALYFAPQRNTKMMNEGWASFVDHNIMAAQGFVSLGRNPGAGIVEYALHKAGVLGGKYSLNPYKVGMMMFLDIEERWNKGQFGDEWDDCKDMNKRLNWDLNLGLGIEKTFEVRRYYDDVSAILEFFTDDFCNKYEFFEWEKRPDGDYAISTRDPKVIREKLMMKHLNGGLPDIRLVDPNHRGKGWFLLQHQWDGRPLYEPYVRETIAAINRIWRNNVILATRSKDGEEEMVCVASGSNADEETLWMTRQEFEEQYT